MLSSSAPAPLAALVADLLAEIGQQWWQDVPWVEEAAARELSHPSEMSLWLFLWLKTEALKLDVEQFANPNWEAVDSERGALVASLLDHAPYTIDEKGLWDRRTGDLLQARTPHHTPARQRG